MSTTTPAKQSGPERDTECAEEWARKIRREQQKLTISLRSHSDHLKHTGPDVESGLIVLGGAMLEEPIREGVPPKMKGSVLMCVADTEEEVWDRVKRDVYYEHGVWDKEKVSSSALSLEEFRRYALGMR
jgi:hypothetical protein